MSANVVMDRACGCERGCMCLCMACLEGSVGFCIASTFEDFG